MEKCNHFSFARCKTHNTPAATHNANSKFAAVHISKHERTEVKIGLNASLVFVPKPGRKFPARQPTGVIFSTLKAKKALRSERDYDELPTFLIKNGFLHIILLRLLCFTDINFILSHWSEFCRSSEITILLSYSFNSPSILMPHIQCKFQTTTHQINSFGTFGKSRSCQNSPVVLKNNHMYPL